MPRWDIDDLSCWLEKQLELDRGTYLKYHYDAAHVHC
jgi:hypothetical protein